MTIAGIQQKFWIKEETTFDTLAAFVATDAVNAIELKFEPSLEFEKTVEHVGTGSLQNEIEGARGGKWSCVCYVAPNAAGVAPDIGALFKAGYGTETIVGGTSTTYSCTDSTVYATGLHSLQMYKSAGESLGEWINGAWVEQIDVEIAGGQAPKVTFSGGFASYGFCYGGATVSGVHAGSATSITLAAGGGKRIGVGAVLQFDTEDNGGVGYTVTDVSTDTLTITPGLASGLSGGEVPKPIELSQTLSGTIQGGIACGLTIDSASINMINGKTSFKTGVMAREGEATTDRPTGLRRGPREVTGEIGCFFLDESDRYHGGAWDGDVLDIEQRAGPDTAASRMKIQTPACRVEVSPIDMPDADASTISLSFVARQDSAAGDEISLVFD